MAHVNNPPPIAEKRPDLPPKLVSIVDTMLAKGRDDRFQTPAELATAIAPFAQGHNLLKLHDDGAPSSTQTVDMQSPTLEASAATSDTVDEVPGTVLQQTQPQKTQSQEPSLLPKAAAGGVFSGRSIAVATAFLGGLAAIFGVVVMLLPTPNGTIRIEIHDPSIQVTVSGDQRYRVKGTEGEFEVAAGEHNLHITSGGTTFQTREFSVGKTAKVALLVTLIEGNRIQVLRGDKVVDEHVINPKTVNQSSEKMSSTDDPRRTDDPKRSDPSEPVKIVTQSQMHSPLLDQSSTSFLRFDRDKAEGSVTSESLGKSLSELKPQQFTVECRARYIPGPGLGLLAGLKYSYAIQVKHHASYVEFGGTNANGKWERSGTSNAPDFPVNEWVHFAAVRDGNEQRLYVNGRLVDKVATDLKLFHGPETPFTIGGGFCGDVDWVRVSKTARYTDDFKPEFPKTADADTLALFKFSEGSGETIHDSSGHGHSGTIVNAQWLSMDSRD